MKNGIKLSLFISILFLYGCVTGTRNISLESPEASSAPTSKGAVYIAEINDLRTFEQKPKSPSTPSVKGKLEQMTAEDRAGLIGRQRNGYGMAMGAVALDQNKTVQDESRKLLITALNNRGYSISDSSDDAITLNADIDKFWAWFVPGFMSVSFESEVSLNLKANDKSATATGSGVNKGQVASNANWILAYKRAYDDFLKNVDQALTELGL